MTDLKGAHIQKWDGKQETFDRCEFLVLFAEVNMVAMVKTACDIPPVGTYSEASNA